MIRDKSEYRGKAAGVYVKYESANERMKDGRKMLFFLGGIAFLTSIYNSAVNVDMILSIMNVVLAVGYIGFAFYS